MLSGTTSYLSARLKNVVSRRADGFFEVADYNLAIRLPKFKMADPIWRLKIRKKLRYTHNWNHGF